MEGQKASVGYTGFSGIGNEVRNMYYGNEDLQIFVKTEGWPYSVGDILIEDYGNPPKRNHNWLFLSWQHRHLLYNVLQTAACLLINPSALADRYCLASTPLAIYRKPQSVLHPPITFSFGVPGLPNPSKKGKMTAEGKVARTHRRRGTKGALMAVAPSPLLSLLTSPLYHHRWPAHRASRSRASQPAIIWYLSNHGQDHSQSIHGNSHNCTPSTWRYHQFSATFTPTRHKEKRYTSPPPQGYPPKTQCQPRFLRIVSFPPQLTL